MIKAQRPKILILFTDGGDQKDFSKEIEEAKKAGITVYIYAIGTHKGAPIPWHGENLKDQNGNIVITKCNSPVEELAIKTGGAYIEGGYKDKSIDMIIQDIKKKFKMHTLRKRKIQDYEELFYYPLTLAIFFMLFAFSSLPKNVKTALLLPMLLTLGQTPSHAGFLDFHEIKQGMSLYRAGSYRDAVRHFEKVADSRRDAPSWYDLGNACYMAGRYKEAIHAYKKAHTRDPGLLYKLYFNMGNAYYRLQKYAKALDAYTFAKKFKTEPDLLFNIELAKKHLKKKPPKSKPPSSQKKKQQQNEQKQKQQNNSDNQKENKQSQSQNRSQNRQQKQKGGENQQKKNAPISPQEMKKWERKLKQSKPKTMPLRFQIKDVQRKKNAKPW
jgi:Ca-activated chloride channel family protein